MPLKSWDEIVRTLSPGTSPGIYDKHISCEPSNPTGLATTKTSRMESREEAEPKSSMFLSKTKKCGGNFEFWDLTMSPKHQEDKVMPPLVDLSNFLAIFLRLGKCCKDIEVFQPLTVVPFLVVALFCWVGTSSFFGGPEIVSAKGHLSFPPATCLLKFQNIFEQKYQMHSMYKVHTPQKNTSTSPCVYSHFPWAPLRCLVVSKP